MNSRSPHLKCGLLQTNNRQSDETFGEVVAEARVVRGLT
jgi:hypothetical protein